MSEEMRTARTRTRVEGGLRTRGIFARKSTPGKPLVTVITVVRNGKEHIERAIQSVLCQTYDNIEYIIVDGASTDGSVDLIKKHQDRLAYWVSEPDKGIYDAMNKGILLSNGEIVGLLNSDDDYEPHAVEFVVDRYLRNPQRRRTIIYGNFHILDETLGIKTEFYSNLKYWKGMTVCHQTMFVSRDIYSEMFLYDLKYKLAADYDFFLKAIRHKIMFITTDQFLVNFRNIGATYTSVLPIYRETLSISRKHFGLLSPRHALMSLKAYTIIAQFFVKRGVARLFGPGVMKNVKIIQNKLFRKKWHNITG